jgi:hypothetical protein
MGMFDDIIESFFGHSRRSKPEENPVGNNRKNKGTSRTASPKTETKPIVTCLGEYEHEWAKVYFHGEAEKLFWNMDPAEIVDAPDRVCSTIPVESLHPGSHSVELEFSDLRNCVYYEDAVLFLWMSMGPRDVKKRLRGLIVLDGDDEAMDYARDCLVRQATKV